MSKQKQIPVMGWREWIALPQLGVTTIKAKIDTGARSSAIHAFDVETFWKDEKHWVRFQMHPLQRNTSKTITAEAEILDEREVRNS
ncbi:MAG: RimK/LysX family protein, partial [Cyanobacteriota bacterium]|nr:RimK/LysX family protein [Cyanobacteriota bacterium]